MASRPLLFSMCLEELPGVGSVTEKLDQVSITRLNAGAAMEMKKPSSLARRPYLKSRRSGVPTTIDLSSICPYAHVPSPLITLLATSLYI